MAKWDGEKWIKQYKTCEICKGQHPLDELKNMNGFYCPVWSFKSELCRTNINSRIDEDRQEFNIVIAWENWLLDQHIKSQVYKEFSCVCVFCGWTFLSQTITDNECYICAKMEMNHD